MTGFVGFGGALEDSEAISTTRDTAPELVILWERIIR
jgi:hypothetical protein